MKDKVIVITGASSGIGAAIAASCAKREAFVVLVARRTEKLEKVAFECGSTTLEITADVTDRKQVKRVVSETISHFGKIDVWVNNVGRGLTRAPSDLTDDDIDSMITINVKSALYGMQEVLPHFRERGMGHIVNVSSMLGRIPAVEFRSAYSAAKHFLNALTASFRAEIQRSCPKIQISLVSPGVVHTDFGLNALHGGPDSRSFQDGQSAEDVAEVIAKVIETREADVYTRTGMKERVIKYYSELGENVE